MNALTDSIGDVEIGVLEHFNDETECFTFNESYVSATLKNRPVLGQLFEDRMPNAIPVGGPIGWFAHLLPQGTMRRWRSTLYGIEEDDSFGLLFELGANLPGAVVLRPTEALSSGSRGLANTNRSTEVVADDRFRFSLAGVQWKLSARSSSRGITTNAQGSGIEYVAKFHSPEFPELTRCEFATMSWAKHAGISTPDFELRNVSEFNEIPADMPIGDGMVYMCRRFDRSNDIRIHMEDFGQILDRPPGLEQYRGSYEEIAGVLRWIAPDSCGEFLNLLVFNLLCGNGDAHLKNFSILYSDGRTASLAPAYDLVSTIIYYQEGREQLALKLGGVDRFSKVSLREFNSVFKVMGWDNQVGRKHVREFVDRVVSAWSNREIQENYSRPHRDRLEAHVKELHRQFYE